MEDIDQLFFGITATVGVILEVVVDMKRAGKELEEKDEAACQATHHVVTVTNAYLEIVEEFFSHMYGERAERGVSTDQENQQSLVDMRKTFDQTETFSKQLEEAYEQASDKVKEVAKAFEKTEPEASSFIKQFVKMAPSIFPIVKWFAQNFIRDEVIRDHPKYVRYGILVVTMILTCFMIWIISQILGKTSTKTEKKLKEKEIGETFKTLQKTIDQIDVDRKIISEDVENNAELLSTKLQKVRETFESIRSNLQKIKSQLDTIT